MKVWLKTIVAAAFLSATQAQAVEPLKVGVSAGPYGEILEFAGKIAAKEGIEVKVIEFTDWNMPNEALARGDIDANNFQHQPYLDNQVKQRGYDLVSVAKSVVVPMGVYSSKAETLTAIKEGSTIAIPNDPTNGARALFLLQNAGLIKLKSDDIKTSIADIAENPKKLKFVELDAAQLPRSLDDVTAAVITLNYAVLAKLDPKKALLLEDEGSKWHLVWAVRKGREADARINRFIEIYRSPEVKQFVQTRFEGSIVPTW
ncbi:MAG TPA: MetQ/NlpA family ABC transporter substrate-binding protein [Azospirillaceae bacterium]|nr:MetQ/NlpA family ABC transporter substrate-binding protein [Azospirillaceae bacterium]